MFTYYTKIKLFDTDAAGVLFFGNQFRLVEEAYEAFLDEHGLSISDVLLKSGYLIPVVHAESDFLTPVLPGEKLRIEISLNRLGTSSFTLGHKIFNREGVKTGEGNTIHACVSKSNFEKIPIPEEIQKILSEL